MSEKTRRYVAVLLAILFVAAFIAALFSPYPRRVGPAGERYEVVWTDGSVTQESFQDAFSCLSGISAAGDVLLIKDEKIGTYVSGNGMKEALGYLEEGALAPMLSMDVALSRLESAALFREYGDMLYYDAGDFFAFDGERVKPTAIGVAEKVFFTGGELTGALLVRTEAQTLVIGDDADFSYKTLYGTAATAEGRNRYRIAGGAIVDTSLGGIFAAGQPLFEEIAVPDVAVCARGALLPCKKLLSLSLPFVGSGPVAAGEEYVGELGYLFTEGQDYFVPDTLKQVTVRGGALVSFAFYHCPALEEIDACGVDPALIERQAFEGLPSLRRLHTPRADVSLTDPEKFTTYVAECGCTVYERKES